MSAGACGGCQGCRSARVAAPPGGAHPWLDRIFPHPPLVFSGRLLPFSAVLFVLLDVHGGVVLASNAIGARIWQLIESRLDGVEIASRLALEYEVPAERARHDVAAFLAALEARGLVTAEEPC